MTAVFISYRQLDAEQCKRVRQFAERVKAEGIEVILDQFYSDNYPGGPDEGWPKWSRDHAQTSSRVLVIGNSSWFRCYENNEQPGVGLGAACEAHNLYQRFYDSSQKNNFMRVVYFDKVDLNELPLDLKAFSRFHHEDNFKEIIGWIGGAISGDKNPLGWPDKIESLKWPIADHDEAREAFAKLVTREASFKCLAIKGNSETGKSHLIEQFYNNARKRIKVCRCARFDFKGTDQIDVTLASFAQDLGVSPPPASGVLSIRLQHIFESLAQIQEPSLLIFDTYEDSGIADRWIRESLLASLHKFEWLRVVIAGQVVPPRHGKLWEDETLVLNVCLPEPDHWLSYAKLNNREFTLNFVKTAHAAVNGKASVLAQLCGPKN